MKFKRSDGPIWYMAGAEFAVLGLMRFLRAGQDATIALSLKYLMGLNGCGLLVRFPVQTEKGIRDLRFLWVV